MIDGDTAISIIESRLTNMIRQGQLIAKYNQSDKSISFYLRDIEVNSQPILTLRVSNHRPEFQGYIRNGFEIPNGCNNVSIEFYKPKRSSGGKKINDKIDNNIDTETFKNITPFAITSFKYSPSNLEWTDFENIYQAILSYLQTKIYSDPLAGTTKSARPQTKIATARHSKYAVPQNISIGADGIPVAATIFTDGADDVVENRINKKFNINVNNMKSNRKQVMRLTESDLHRVIKESVKKVLKESGDYGIFDAFNSNRHPEDGFYIRYNGEFYHIPQEEVANYQFLTRDGRREIIDAIRNGVMKQKEPIPGATTGSWGYKKHSYNADAW